MKNLADVDVQAGGHRILIMERHDGVTILLDGKVLYDSDQELQERVEERGSFGDELRTLLNRHSIENTSNTPDFVLARFIAGALSAFETATESRDEWYGVKLEPGNVRMREER